MGGEPRQVLVLSREGCCLCDEAITVLEEVSREVPLTIEVRDVDSDPELARTHGTSIPVVFVDGSLAFKVHVDRDRLLRRLRGGGILSRLSARLRWPGRG